MFYRQDALRDETLLTINPLSEGIQRGVPPCACTSAQVLYSGDRGFLQSPPGILIELTFETVRSAIFVRR